MLVKYASGMKILLHVQAKKTKQNKNNVVASGHKR